MALLDTRLDKNKGLLRELNPGPLAPEARIIPLDQAAVDEKHPQGPPNDLEVVARRCSAGARGRVLIVVHNTSARKTRTCVSVFSIMRLNHELFQEDVPVELSRKLSGTCGIMSSLRASARDANGSCAYRFRIQFDSSPTCFQNARGLCQMDATAN